MKLYGTDQLLNICKASVLPRAEEVRAGERERPRGASWGGSEGLGGIVGFRGSDVETSVGCLFATLSWGFSNEKPRF